METRKVIAELEETQVMLVQVAKTELVMTSEEGRQVVLSASAETRKVMVEVEGTQVVAIMGATQVLMAKVKRMKVMFSELTGTLNKLTEVRGIQ